MTAEQRELEIGACYIESGLILTASAEIVPAGL